MGSLALIKSTPVLLVDAIEPSLPFWQERLGFDRPVEIPDEGYERLGFVILRNGAVEVMYQTITSLQRDVPQQAATHRGDKSHLFIEVEDLDAVARSLEGFPIVLPLRATFYGSHEIGYREPGGHFVTFAEFKR
jgi:glyoxalase/bleomycin resistance protein/dioxygenase superfamily protein